MWAVLCLTPVSLHVEDEVEPTRVCDCDDLRLLIPQSGKVVLER